MEIGDIFTKENYTEHAIWCNENGATIKDLGGGKYQIIAIAEPLPQTYAEKRLAEYPAISDQLDMIYWDKVNDTNLWQEKIAEIKAKYPKEA